jgi:hypothetical protein
MLKRFAISFLLLALSAHGQTPAPFTLTPPANAPVTYASGVGVVFSVPVTVTQTANSITFTWGAVPPVPPIPTPVPVQTGNLYVLALFDKTIAPTAAQAAVQASATVGPALAALTTAASTTWAVGDVASPAFMGWVADAKAAGIPALVILSVDQNNKGTLVEAVPLPTPESAVIAEVKKVRGLP